MINDVIRESLASANRAIGVANLESLFRANRGNVGSVVRSLPVDKKLHSRLSPSATVRLWLKDKVVWKSDA